MHKRIQKHTPCDSNQKRKSVALITLGKLDFKAINSSIDKEGFLILEKDLICQEDINILIHMRI